MVGGCVDGAATEPNVRPRDAQRAILDAFDDHQVVGGFSASHGNKDVDDFLLDLVRNPDLPAAVDDIVIECGNAFHQDLLDDYVNGADVDVRPVWRTTSQPECGFSVFVEQLVPLVRRINEGLPDDRRLRVLAADPPLDWSRIDSVEELERLSDRDGFAASLMADEVLARGRKALMFFGINHMRHRPGTLVGQYEARGYDGLTFVIDDHQGFGNQDPGLRRRNDELEDRMADWPVPSVIEIENTWLADLDAPYFNDPLPGDDQGKGNPGVDGYLFVGRRDGLLREGRSAQAMTDETYLAQLDDIADRLGEPADSPWRTVRRREASEGVFLYEPGR
ncbi:hypothetical protein BLA60_34215 [Actinophytocola xinjiangensis]|uniref:Erythromycin esterase n=2 Tax=Actinophytocola xinjiangensis TaxID=485602 RepID=A0A7Z0WFD1_9PSEU|nr:hypothetical protein BLA60_34215 [Actinophytocola xinjiangensis]